MSENTDKFLERVRARWALAVSAHTDLYERAQADLEFCDPEHQWPENIKNLRGDKPCLTVDVLTPVIKQIVNEQRQNRPSVKVSPVDSKADVETAQILQGIVRHIEYDSDADVAYDRACESQVRCGIGFIRVLTEYSDPMSFDQDIKISSIPNPFMVHLDPSSTEPDGSDAEWGFIGEDIVRENYLEAYPDSKLAQMSASTWQGIADQAPGWMSGEKAQACRVLEYFEKYYETATLYKLQDGSTTLELKKGQKSIAQRKTQIPKVKWYKLNAVEILEQTVWECEYIPIIPVYGDELIVAGDRRYFGLVHRAKDVQKMINVWKSVQTEIIGLSSKAPWIATAATLKGYEDKWAVANQRDFNYLPWNAYDEHQRQLPPPVRDVSEPPIQAVTMALAGSMEDLKAVTGIYDPNLGKRDSASQSGVAIRNLQHQGMTGNFHFQDNLSRSMRHLGRILIQLIRKYYDVSRVTRVIGVDDQEKMVLINGEAGEQAPEGQERHYDLSTGRYDVTVSVGPSYTSKRQENLAVLMELLKVLPPEQAALVSDLIASQLDAPIAEEISKRLKTLLPPQLQEQDKGKKDQVPPQVAQQMQALGQQHEMLTAKVHELTDQLQDQQIKLQADYAKAELDSQTKLKIAEMNQETEMLKIQASLDAASVMAEIQEIRQHQDQIAQVVLGLAQQSAPEQPQEAEAMPTEAPQGAPVGEPPPSIGGYPEVTQSPMAAGNEPNFAGLPSAGGGMQ